MPPTTQASGRLVDDPSGAPLGGVKVGLAPWVAGATPIPEGTTAPDGTFSFTAPNGHYLLVIGSDSPSDTTRPTIHDNITLTGGTQALKGPVLPPIVLTTPPPAETNGNYRLTTLDPTNEVPCLTAFNSSRISYSLPTTVSDEWLTENAREINAVRTNPAYTPGMVDPRNTWGYLTTLNVATGGGSNCSSSMNAAFNAAATFSAKNSDILWFGGNYYVYQNGNQATGEIEYPRDPRSFTDPNTTPPVWP